MVPSGDKEQRALDAVVARATVDRDFRRQLLADPRRAIRESFGVLIPSHFRIKFIEREPGLDALVVLPDFKGGTDELADRDLEAITGGVEEDATWSDAVNEEE